MSRESLVPDYPPFSVPVLFIFHYLSQEQIRVLQSYFDSRQRSRKSSAISLWLICQNSAVGKQLASVDDAVDATIFNPHTDGFKEVSKHQGCNPKTIHSIFRQLRQHQFIVSASTDGYRQRATGNREFYFIRGTKPAEKSAEKLSSSTTTTIRTAPIGVWSRKVIKHLDQIGQCAKDGMARLVNPTDRRDEKEHCTRMVSFVDCLIDFIVRQPANIIDPRWQQFVLPYNLQKSMREEVEKVNKLMHQLSPLPTCLVVCTLDYHLEHFLSFN